MAFIFGTGGAGGTAAPSGYAWQTASGGVPGVIPVPTTLTTVVTASPYAKVAQINLSNLGASAIQVTITDMNGANLTPPMSLAPNTLYAIALGNEAAQGGVQWVASAAGVQGWIGGY